MERINCRPTVDLLVPKSPSLVNKIEELELLILSMRFPNSYAETALPEGVLYKVILEKFKITRPKVSLVYGPTERLYIQSLEKYFPTCAQVAFVEIFSANSRILRLSKWS
jgi:hypothetical protein